MLDHPEREAMGKAARERVKAAHRPEQEQAAYKAIYARARSA